MAGGPRPWPEPNWEQNLVPSMHLTRLFNNFSNDSWVPGGGQLLWAAWIKSEQESGGLKALEAHLTLERTPQQKES